MLMKKLMKCYLEIEKLEDNDEWTNQTNANKAKNGFVIVNGMGNVLSFVVLLYTKRNQ